MDIAKVASAAVVIVVALQLVYARTIVHALATLPQSHAVWWRRMRYQGRHWL